MARSLDSVPSNRARNLSYMKELSTVTSKGKDAFNSNDPMDKEEKQASAGYRGYGIFVKNVLLKIEDLYI